MSSYGTNEMTNIDDSPVDLKTPPPPVASSRSLGVSTDSCPGSTSCTPVDEIDLFDDLFMPAKALEELKKEMLEGFQQQNNSQMLLQSEMDALIEMVLTRANGSGSSIAQPSEFIQNNPQNPENLISRALTQNVSELNGFDHPTAIDNSMGEQRQNNTALSISQTSDVVVHNNPSPIALNNSGMNGTRSATEPDATPMGQYCSDRNHKRSRPTSASTNEVNYGTPTTSSNCKVRRRKAVKSKQNESTSIQLEDQSEENDANIFTTHKDGSYRMKLCHTLQDQNIRQHDRACDITDRQNQPLVLTVNGNQLPLEGFINMALVCGNGLERHYSIFQLVCPDNYCYDRIRRPFKSDRGNQQKLRIGKLRINKQRYHDREIRPKQRKLGQEHIYTITKFPSGKNVATEPFKTHEEFKKKYNLEAAELVVWLSPHVRICDQLVHYLDPWAQVTSSGNSTQNISNPNLDPSVIYFDIYDECSISFLLQIIGAPSCGLDSKYIWLHISLTTNENYSHMYQFVTENGDITPFYYIPITESNSEISFNIRKLTLMEIRNDSQLSQVLCDHQNLGQVNHEVHPYINDDVIRTRLAALGYNRFFVELRFFSGGENPDIKYAFEHPLLKPRIAAEFIEDYTTSSAREVVSTTSSVNDCQQHQTGKRFSNECDFSLDRLPVVKCSRLN